MRVLHEVDLGKPSFSRRVPNESWERRGVGLIKEESEAIETINGDIAWLDNWQS
jgi:hypothetical protein